MQLTRVYRFAASHRLHSDQLTPERNSDLYGKCNNPYGHGHDYVLQITVEGRVEPASGRVVNVASLDRFVHEHVISVFDHKDMNTDVRDFEGVPTTENLASDIGRRLERAWNGSFGDAKLARVWIQETPKNTFELRMK